MTDELNLLPESVRKTRIVVSRMKCWGLTWLVMVIVSISVCIVSGQNRQHLEATAARLASQADPLRKIQSEQKAMQREAQQILKREAWMTDADSNQTLALMGIVSQAASRNQGRISVHDLKLTSFERPVANDRPTAAGKRASKEKVEVEQRMQLELNGHAVDDLAVASFVAVLREADVFESVELRSSVSEVLNNHETRHYEVTCVY